MAEKKSTKGKVKSTRKVDVKTIQEPPQTGKAQNEVSLENIPDENQQVGEPIKPQSISVNWDVLGFASAAITLAGAGFLFIIGWAYYATWYVRTDSTSLTKKSSEVPTGKC